MRYSQMTPEERNRQIRFMAHGFSAERFKLDNPGCTEDQAWAHAERHWRGMVSAVIDFMAVSDCIDEAEEAAPWN